MIRIKNDSFFVLELKNIDNKANILHLNKQMLALLTDFMTLFLHFLSRINELTKYFRFAIKFSFLKEEKILNNMRRFDYYYYYFNKQSIFAQIVNLNNL